MLSRVIQWLRDMDRVILRPFLVSPSSGSSLGYMDGIRACAVLWVIVFHSWVLSGHPPLAVSLPGGSGAHLNLTPLVASGFLGVQLFFVLSGFLLSQYWLKPDYLGKPHPSLVQYAKQRLARIVPGYYCCLFLLLLFFVPTYIPVANVFSQAGAFMLVAHLLFLQYIFPVSSASYTIDGSLWTLTMEMIFYVVLPLLMWCFLRMRWIIALSLSVGLSLGWLFLTRESMYRVVLVVEHQTPFVPALPEASARYFLGIQFPAHLVTFALGISLANLWVRRETNQAGRFFRVVMHPWAALGYFLAGGCLLYLVVFYLPQQAVADYYLHELTAAVGFTLMIAGVLFGKPWLRTVLSGTPLRFIGIISYSMYLWHMPLIYVFNAYSSIVALPPTARYPAVLWLTLIAVTALSTLLYLGVERPFMLLARKRQQGPALRAAANARITIADVDTVPVQSVLVSAALHE